MKRIITCLNCAALTLLLLHSSDGYSQPIGKNVKRILFLGNSITYSGNYVNNIEAYLVANNPSATYEIFNLGLPSETVSGLSEPGHAEGKFPRPDLHERLSRVLAAIKPDLVFACYGMNDGLSLPLDTMRFRKFREGIFWLHDEVTKAGAKIVHITPPIFDEQKKPAVKYAATLDRYSDWLISLRKSHNWEVIDIHFPMLRYLQAHRKIDSAFHLDGFALAADGVHPGETGHWIMSREILAHIGFKDVLKEPSIEMALKFNANGRQILELVRRKQAILRDAWLSETKHLRPGIPAGLPVNVATDSVVAINSRLSSLPKTQ